MMTEKIDKILSEISEENMFRHVDYLVNVVGERQSGSKEYHEASDYIFSQLKEHIDEAWVDHFPMYTSYPVDASLHLTQPINREISALPICHTLATDGFLEGELLDLKNGHYDDYVGVDVQGKILLTDMTWTPGRPEKARIAQEMGAKALIIMNWGKPEDENIQMGGVKSQWGNPTAETIKDVVDIPVLSITRKAGEFLRDLCSKEKTVRVKLSSNVTREWITASQPMGIVRGNGSRKEIILIGSHLDAWGKTAICNATGNALLLELVRILKKHQDSLNCDVYFCFWDGHEVAECGGSTWFVDNYWGVLREKTLAYFNVDNLAIQGTSILGVESVLEMKDFLLTSLEDYWTDEVVWHDAHKGGGDSSFFGIGIPYVAIATEYSEDELKELNYAFYSPWLHTEEDTVDKIDPELYKKHAEIFLACILRLSHLEEIPYNIEKLLQTLINDLNSLSQWDEELLLELDRLQTLAASVLKRYSDLVAISGGEIPNTLRQRMVYRLSPILRLTKTRYDQDPCCYHFSDFPIPGLYLALWHMKKSKKEQDSHNFYLWANQAIRVKNRISDELKDAKTELGQWRMS
jgi:hypothetical protein